MDKADEFFAENTRRSVVSYILIGLMAGIVVSCGVIAISVITNTSIKNEEDIQKCSGLSVLGTIPDYKGGKKRKEKIMLRVHLKIRENLLFHSIWHIVCHRWEKGFFLLIQI